ncbi:MAG: RimK/LysX family protein [Lysobacteraceae bacterium]|nr:ATP-dependent zinc protease [Xanthomonadales bacterium]HPF72863.1 RimK/LysX family protein [Xanthomonadaceae bacterium]HRX99104.1 RimK/LysX family protein [Xanthomonadaceae bacterium]
MPLIVGWREWMALPAIGVDAICAKVDTGAKSSALHVDAMETFERDGAEWVRFTLHPGRLGSDGTVDAEARVVDRRLVTDSGGHETERLFIATDLLVGGLRYPIELNLTSRHNMRFPMLLGRTAMAGRLQVDPEASFRLGER